MISPPDLHNDQFLVGADDRMTRVPSDHVATATLDDLPQPPTDFPKVHNAGIPHVQGPQAGCVRFELSQPSTAQSTRSGRHSAGLARESAAIAQFILPRRDDHFAADVERDLVLDAEFLHQLLPQPTIPGL